MKRFLPIISVSRTFAKAATLYFAPILVGMALTPLSDDITLSGGTMTTSSQIVGGDVTIVHEVRSFLKAEVYAARKKDEKKKSRKTPLIRQKTFKKLQEAQEYAEKEEFGKTIQILDGIKSRSKKLNSYELAQLWNFYAYIYSAQEKYTESIEAYKKVLKQENIPEALEQQSIYKMAQLNMVLGKYQEAIKQFEQWFSIVPSPTATAYAMVGQAYYQTKQYDLGIEKIEHAVSMFEAKQKVPRESWYLLLRAMYFEKDDIQKVREILETLMVLYPKRDYWVMLASVYGELKRDDDRLAATDAAYEAGYLKKEGELLNLAYMYLSNDVPYKAAKIIDKGIKDGVIKDNAKNLRTLANSWRASQELKKSIPVMEKAARLSEEGELFARLGNIYLDNEQYDKAVTALRHGLKKGGIKRPDLANIALGMALYNLDKLDDAEKLFKEAKKDKRTKKMAMQWVGYLAKERKRRKQLSAGLIQ